MRTSVWIAVVCPATRRVLIAKRGARTRNAGQWNFFGGGLDRGERPKQTARRELREEGGLAVSPQHLLPITELVLSGKRHLLFGVALDAEVPPRLNKESEESRWVRIEELTAHHGLHEPTRHFTPLVETWLGTLAEDEHPAVAVTVEKKRRRLSARALDALAPLKRLFGEFEVGQ